MTSRRSRLFAVALLVAVAGTGCSKDQGSRQAFCTKVAEVPSLSGVLASYDQADPTELTRRLEATRSAYDELRKAAPSTISDDTDAMVDLVDVVLDAVADHASDPAAARAEVREAMASNGGAGPAAAKVAAYASDRCGVVLDPTGVVTTTGG